MTDKTTQAVNNDLPLGHGNTPAAWAFTGIALVGALIATVAACIPNHLWVYIGVAIMVIGGIVGLGMKKAGYGAGGSKVKSHH